MDSQLRRHCLVAGVAAFGLTIAPDVAAQTASSPSPAFKVAQVGPTGSVSAAYGLNATGQTVGVMLVDDENHSYQWFNGVSTDLDNVVHFSLRHPYFGVGIHQAFDISNGGQIVGTARLKVDCDPEDFVVQTAYILSPGVLSDLGTPFPGDALVNLFTLGPICSAHDSAAIAISNANHVVGWADASSAGGVVHAFLARPVGGSWLIDADNNGINDALVDLGTLDAFSTVSSATDVNDSGVVVGYSYTVTASTANETGYHAFRIVPVGGVWNDNANNPGQPNNLMEDLGTLGGLNSWARGINNSGVIVGESDTSDRRVRAFRWSNGTMTDLGTLGGNNSSAAAINDSGDIVGWAEDADGVRRAVIWLGGTQIRDLNSQVLVTDQGKVFMTEGRAINEHRQVVGWGNTQSSSATQMAFLLRLATTTEVSAADAILNGQVDSSTSTDGGTTGGANGGGSTGGVTIVGTPQNLGDPATDTTVSGTTTDETPTAGLGVGGLCGTGLVSTMPLMLAGLVAMRRRMRR